MARADSLGGSRPAGRAPVATTLAAPLAAFDRGDLDRAGGKGANLGELMRAGFPVPAGFVVTTAAYDLLLDRNGLAERIPELLAAGDGDGAAIRAELTAVEVPPEIAEAVRADYRQLGGEAVAVRSSATAEDLPGAAFAGQQDTYLGVVGEQALLDALRRCWASLWTDRAISYRRRQGIEPASARIAVVVQRMVPAETAGVMFTANPVTGARDEVVVDASAGLGEAVVSGLVTPDHFVLDKRRRRLRECRAGRREVTVRARPEGGTEHLSAPAEQSTRSERAFPRRELRRLGTLGSRIERHFQAPQDIEWAWAGGKAFILQARPMTALPDPPQRVSRVQRAMAPMAAEMVPVRPYPLDVTAWTVELATEATSMARVAGISPPSYERMLVEEDGVVVRLEPSPPRPTPYVLLAPATLLRQVRRYDPAGYEADPLVADMWARARDLESRDLAELSWQELLATYRQALPIVRNLGELRRRYIPRPVLALGLLRLSLAALRRNDLFWTLLSSVETKTTEANRALEALAATVRYDPALAATFAAHEPAELLATLREQPTGRPFLDELAAFLDDYGHRETTTALLASQPTWKDDPAAVLGLVQGLAATPARPDTGRPAAEVAREELLAHPALSPRLLRSPMSRLLDEAREFPRVRENTHFHATLALPTVHRTMRELGRRLVAAGVLDEPGDVFHLKLAELERVGDSPPAQPVAGELGDLAAGRKARRTELAGTPLVDRRWSAQVEAGEDVLARGTGGSRGVATGPARIVRDSSDFGRLRSGEVLVAPYTNPAWTPLFQRAVAVIVDSGSAASHAAIVAREYGIPAVMGTGDATGRLADGQPVRVDGTSGVVSEADPGSEKSRGEPPAP